MYQCFSCNYFVRRGLVDGRYNANNTCTIKLTKPMQVNPHREACAYYEMYLIDYNNDRNRIYKFT